MTRVVDPGTFNHDKVGLSLALERIEGGNRHLRQARFLLLKAIDLIAHVARGEQSQTRELDSLFAILDRFELRAVVHDLPAGAGSFLSQVAPVDADTRLGGVGEEVTQSTTPEKVDLAAEQVVAQLLGRDLVLGITVIDVRRVRSGCARKKCIKSK